MKMLNFEVRTTFLEQPHRKKKKKHKNDEDRIEQIQVTNLKGSSSEQKTINNQDQAVWPILQFTPFTVPVLSVNEIAVAN